VDTQAVLFLASVVGWWAAPWYEPRVWGFGWFSGLMLIPTVLVCLFLFGRDLPPIWIIYAIACLASILAMRKVDKGGAISDRWTLREEFLAAGVNFLMVFLGTYGRF
jgi:hypothetical protein